MSTNDLMLSICTYCRLSCNRSELLSKKNGQKGLIVIFNCIQRERNSFSQINNNNKKKNQYQKQGYKKRTCRSWKYVEPLRPLLNIVSMKWRDYIYYNEMALIPQEKQKTPARVKKET